VLASLRSVLSGYRFGAGDPTTRLADGEFWRATHTPCGAGTLRITWHGEHHETDAWGPGAEWLLARAEPMAGGADPGYCFEDAHPAIMAAQRNHPGQRFGASGTLYHELIPTILGQRITGGEAIRQWHRLVYRLGAPAPGPNAGLRLPPTPDALAAQPAWWFHPLGIEAKRADALRTIARHAAHLQEWSGLASAEAGARLALLPGLGQWTIGSVLALSHGDPDALAVGDFHLKHVIVHALTGRARGTDDEMLALLAPYAGQRGRAARLLLSAGHRAPRFGPRQRVVDMTRW
jgi:3-methyladenine DNA glycosylase/8-oxoguanine DNA glycosylase